MLKSYQTFFLFIFVSLFCFSQNQSEVYNDIDYYVRNTSPQKGLIYIDSLLASTNNKSLQNIYNTAKFFPMVQAEMYDVILQNSQKLLEDTALESQLKTIVYLRRSLVYEILEDFEKSLLELKKAEDEINTNSKLKNSEIEAELLYRYASVYRIQGNLKLAEDYTDQSIALATKYNHKNALAVAYMVKGFLAPKNEYDKKIGYYYEALQNYKSHKDTVGMSAMYYSLSLINKIRGTNNLALAYTDSIIKTSKNFEYVFSYNLAYKIRSEIFKERNQLDSALVNFEKFTELSKKEVTAKQALKVKEFEYEFLVEKEKINKIQIEKENKNISEYNNKLKLLITSLLGVIAIILFLAYTVVVRNKSIKQQQKEIETANTALNSNVKEKELLLKELNHRVKNNLSLILSLVNFQSKEIDDDLYKSKFTTLKQRIEAIAIVHNQIMYSDDAEQLNNKQDIGDYITKIAESLIGLDAREIKFKTKISKIYINIDSALPIGILVNELVSNSIKHAKAKDGNLEISISVKEENNFIALDYEDNGTHFNTSKNTNNLGLTIIKSMIKQLKGNYSREASKFSINILKSTKSNV